MSTKEAFASLDFVKLDRSPTADEYVQQVVKAARRDMAQGYDVQVEPTVEEDSLVVVQPGRESLAETTRKFKDEVDATKDESLTLVPTLLQTLHFKDDSLSMTLDRVKERPLLDAGISDRVQPFSDACMNTRYSAVHEMAANVEKLISNARRCATRSGASVFNAFEVLDKIRPVFQDTCEGSTEQFEERLDAQEQLNEHESKENQRQEELRHYNVDAAEQLQSESIAHLDKAVVLAEKFAAEVDERMEEEKKADRSTVQAVCAREVNDVVFGEKEELGSYDRQCANDIKLLRSKLMDQKSKSLAIDQLHAEAALNVAARKSKNKKRQEELERQLVRLRNEQTELEEEEGKITEWHVEGKDVIAQVDDELKKKLDEVEDLQTRVTASLKVMGYMEECSSEVLAVSEKVRARNEQELRLLQIASTWQLHKGLLASAVAFTAMIKDCKTNISILQEKRGEQTSELRKAAKSALTMYVNKLKLDIRKLEEEMKHYKQLKDGYERKMKEINEKIEAVTAKLQFLEPEVQPPTVEMKVAEYENALKERWEDMSSVDVMASLSLASM